MKDIVVFQIILQGREILNTRFKYFTALCLLIAPLRLLAQDLLFDSANIAMHKRKVSSHNFSISSPASNSIISFDDVKIKNPFSKKMAIIVFAPKDPGLSKQIEKSLLYSIPNLCSESRVVLDEVYHHTEGSEKLDLLIYNPSDSAQAKKAREMRNIPLAPWDPTYDPSAGYDSVDAKIQDLARVMNPSCLPARIKFIYVGSKRYKETRYGEKVWED